MNKGANEGSTGVLRDPSQYQPMCNVRGLDTPVLRAQGVGAMPTPSRPQEETEMDRAISLLSGQIQENAAIATRLNAKLAPVLASVPGNPETEMAPFDANAPLTEILIGIMRSLCETNKELRSIIERLVI